MERNGIRMIRKTEHVALIVSNLDRAIDYYCGMFGFRLRTRGESATRAMAFLFHENQPDFEIELICDLIPQQPYSERSIVNHLAFTVDDIDEAMAHYKSKGVEFLSEKPNQTFEGAKTIFFYGPDRELLQLVEPSPERK